MLPPLRCLVVDDQPATRDQLVRALRDEPYVTGVCAVADAAGALRLLRDVEIDVALVEVLLPGMDGLELAAVLRRFAVPPAVVFVTRCPDRAGEARRLGALDYVSKPVSPTRLISCLRAAARGVPRRSTPNGGRSNPDAPAVVAAGGQRPVNGSRPPAAGDPRFVAALGGSPASAAPGGDLPASGAIRSGTGPAVDDLVIQVEHGGASRLVRGSMVRWAQARGDYVRLHVEGGSHVVRARLASLADEWQAAGMIRIHRSYLVQPRFVEAVRRTESGQLAALVDGRWLPVSRRRAQALRSRLPDPAASPDGRLG